MANWLKNLSGWYRLFIVFAGVWTIASIIVFYSFFPDKDHVEKEKLNDIAEFVSVFLGFSTKQKHYALMHERNDNPYYRELSQEEQGKIISDIESGKVEDGYLRSGHARYL